MARTLVTRQLNQFVDLRRDLVAFWKLEEASGTRFDATERGNSLSAVNGPGNAAGKIGNALSLTAASLQRIDRGEPGNGDLTMGDTDYSISCWININNNTTTQGFVAKDAGGATNRDYNLRFLRSGVNRFQLTSTTTIGNVQAVALGFGLPSTGTWIFLAAWHDRTAKTFNIQVNNGTIQSSAAYVGTMPSNPTVGFKIGESVGNYTDGLIDAVGIWKRLLTAQEWSVVYNNGREFPFSTLVTGRSLAGARVLA